MQFSILFAASFGAVLLRAVLLGQPPPACCRAAGHATAGLERRACSFHAAPRCQHPRPSLHALCPAPAHTGATRASPRHLLQGASIAANVFLGSSLVLCTAASYVSSAFLPYAPGVLGCGAISLVGYAQVGRLRRCLALGALLPAVL